MARYTFFIVLILLCSSCVRHDKFRARVFALDEETVLASIDSFYRIHPQYKAPGKWTIRDGLSLSMNMHNTTERRFYFPFSIEEMYYVTLSADEGKTKMIISAVHTNTGWHLEKDLTPDEIQRMEKRFDDKVISQLEILTSSSVDEQ